MSARARLAIVPLLATMIAAGSWGVGPLAQAVAVTLPSGFGDELVAAIGAPTAVAFTPDGRMLVTTQPGQVRIVKNNMLLPAPALDLTATTCSNSERGLLGATVDPAFTSNRFVYLFYTFKKHGTCPTNTSLAPVNRVSRFVLSAGDVIDPASETVLVDNIHSPNGNHNAGDLSFGKDGLLYITTGDGGCDYAGGGCAGSNDASRDRHVLLGKVLRITAAGGIPAGNPFTGTGSARCNVTGSTTAGTICQETFAWGLRNPFRFAFDPNADGTRFFINDVGQNAWEEIDLAAAGADYGWNVREGHCATGSTTDCGAPPAGMTNPIFDYGHTSGCASITGGAFVPAGVWPGAYDGDYLYADYVCGTIFRLEPNGGGAYASTAFATGLGSSSAVHLTFGPWGSSSALYYTTYADGGQVRRIVHLAGNTAPTAAIAASPTAGPPPLAVAFDGSASSDPDGDALTYEWDFGDGQTQTTSEPTTAHTYATNGSYTASLRVRDARGAASDAVAVTITVGAGNTPPEAVILSPADGERYVVGQTLTLSGSASDAQDGQLSDEAMSWTVLLHHGTHTHPYAGPIAGNQVAITGPAPEDLAATENSFLEVILTATDSGGATATVARTVQPVTVALTFATKPVGLLVEVNGTSFTGPSTIVSWQGWALTVSAPSPQGVFTFFRWSDRGAQTHVITTPASPVTYTAQFKRSRTA